jgi:RHS repeat-associated protein
MATTRVSGFASRLKNLCFVALVPLLISTASMTANSASNVEIARPVLALGRTHALMLKSDGTVWSWGSNHYGQLGNVPSDAERPLAYEWSPTPIREPSILGAVSVAAGDYHSLVLKHDGTVLAFGRNNNGQLGLGTTATEQTPVRITNLSSVVAIAAGMDVSMAILSDGSVKAWGFNGAGVLGIGSSAPEYITSPTTVTNLTGVLTVAIGYNHALALCSNGVVFAWGRKDYGQLGDGTLVDHLAPVMVTNGIVAIAAGEYCSFAVTTNRTVLSWGASANGRLGFVSSENVKVPTRIAGLTNVSQIQAGSRQGYATDNNGDLFVWGYNGNYLSKSYTLGLGYTSAVQITIPTKHVYQDIPKILYMAGSAPKIADGGDSPYHLSAGLYEDDMVRIWGWQSAGTANFGNLGLEDRLGAPSITTASMRWGYTNHARSVVVPNAHSRGSKQAADFASFVVPLDLQVGEPLNHIGGVVTNLLPFFTNNTLGYHFNFTNSPLNGQTNLALRIPYQNPIAAFGSRVGGSALYTERSYRFAVFGGCPTLTNDYPMLNDYSNAIQLDVYAKTNFVLVGTANIPMPFYLLTNGSWFTSLSNGLASSVTAFGLTTTLSTRSYPSAYGVTNNGVVELSHQATAAAANYIYVIKVKGLHGGGWVSLLPDLSPAWQPLYTMEFDPAPPWNIRFLSQVHFEGKPAPSHYDGKSLEELQSTPIRVTNTVLLSGTNPSYTNLDQSPELWRHPILDAFVEHSKHDPLALARFVQNEIELTDAVDYFATNQITAGQIRLVGVTRSALGTFLERQGSPVEQCALLIYLLRQAGVPAVYALPPSNGMEMRVTRLSKMLRLQLRGAIDPRTGLVNTNEVVAINYPWVTAYLENRWVHLFPWIKDTEIIEGPNLYDFMPTNYNNAMKWVVGYLYGRPEIVGPEEVNETPEVLFPRFVKKHLLLNAPGISFDELGIQAVNRRKALNSWAEFPTPCWVASENWTAETLSDPILTNASFQNWNPNIFPPNHIFNTTEVTVQLDGTNVLSTGVMRSCDLHGRTFLLYHEQDASDNVRMKLNLKAYRPDTGATQFFTNDLRLLNAQEQVFLAPNPSRAFTVGVTLALYRIDGNTNGTTREFSIQKGDLNAICLNYGRVTKEMLQPLAQDVWNVEREIKANPGITNTLTDDRFHGPLAYLMGMAYYEKVNRFMPVNARIHGRSPISTLGIGTGKLSVKKDNRKDSGLPKGRMIYLQPAVDMFFWERVTGECPTARPDSGAWVNTATDAFNILTIVDGSAKEHDVINSFFSQSDAISTVRLLQIAAGRHATNTASKDILFVNQANVNSVQTNDFFQFSTPPQTVEPGDMDFRIWSEVKTTVLKSPENQAYVTPGSITNDSQSYLGTGALIIDSEGSYAALIGGNANGGWGNRFPAETSFAPANLASVSLNISWSGNYSVNYMAPSGNYHPLTVDSFSSYQAINIWNDAKKGLFEYTPFASQWAFQNASCLNLGPGRFNDLYAYSVLNSESRACLGWMSDGLQQKWSAVSDPVHAVTGEFYVDATDLSLVAPLPLEIRRNYCSLNTADNEFGIGWKLSFTPYISVATNQTVMYAAEPDGSVVAYETTNSNLWLPTLSRNPQLVNNRNAGIGSTANLMLSRIERRLEDSKTNFYLFSPNGDTRIYEQRDFPILGTNTLDRARPYLKRWTDSRGNSLSFTFGTNATEADYGQLQRVDSSSGGYLAFKYDVYGHIVEARSGDGRQLAYRYDDFGDLVKVVLPDASEINYEYSHSTQAVTKDDVVSQEPYSMHLLTREEKPDGRLLANVYDSQRRVTIQAATVGPDLNLVTNATFVYANDFVLTNSITNVISGTTTITDVFGKATRYDYTKSRITKITDPLLQTIEQDWFDENPTQPGYYPRSLWKTKDKRGLRTEYRYDAFGNATNVILSGNLTGASETQTATSQAVFNTNNLPVLLIDALGNSNAVSYDAAFKFLPRQLVSYKQGQAVLTNLVIYGNASNVVTFGNSLWTHLAFGLRLQEIRAFNSSDAATNEWQYNGGGFVTNQIHYTAANTPAIANSMFYNGRGELYQRVDAAGRRYRYDYDGLGRVISSETFEAGQSFPLTWEYSYYNHNGEKTWADGPQFDPEDYVWCDYDGAGRQTVEVRWRSQARADGRGVEAVPGDALYSITSYYYDPFGNLTNTVDPVGNYSVMKYDDIGQMTRKVLYASGNTPLATNSMSYEPGGLVTNAINSLGGVTETRYTASGLPVSQKNPDGSTNSWEYDLLGRPTKEVLPNKSYWETAYDDLNRTVVRRFKNLGGVTLATATQIFDRRGNVVTNIAAEGGVFYTVYDQQDRPTLTGGPPTVLGVSTQQVSRIYYDGAGVAVTNENSLGQRTITLFDAAQRPTATEVRDLLNANALVSYQSTSYSSNHHSVRKTLGTGGGAVSSAVFLDSFGSPVLTHTYPTANSTNITLSVYDAAGRLVRSQDELQQVTTLTYDGLSRVRTRRLPDGATVTNNYNAEGALTTLAMPGGLTWSATYNSANQKTSEVLANGGQTTRQFGYTFHPSGSFAGLLQQSVDGGRSITHTYAYDDFLRVSTDTAVGSLPEHGAVTSFGYDANGTVTNLLQTSGINPTTELRRRYDGYGQLTNEMVLLGGATNYAFDQKWDAAGRRATLKGANAQFDYQYRVDGLLSRVTGFGSAYNFSYGDNGLLSLRSNPWRVNTINSRDGRGRVLGVTTTIGASAALVESQTWRANTTLDTYSATRAGSGAFNDARGYAYTGRGQLQTESLQASASAIATATYDFDAAKLGVRTRAGFTGGLTNVWAAAAGSPDSLARINLESGPMGLYSFQASGLAFGAATVFGTLDGTPLGALDFTPLPSGRWTKDLTLASGSHTLSVSAVHPLGRYTNTVASAFSVQSVTGTTNTYDDGGYVVQRRSAGAQTNTLKWDAAGRLVRVIQRNPQASGYDWSAVYDGLGRRLRTTHTNVTSGVPAPSGTVLDSLFDPQVEFLEVGVALNGARTWKVLGPDLDGHYGTAQGVGALEATVRESDQAVTPVVQDRFGNALATVVGGQAEWTPVRVSGYGPVLGDQAPVLSASAPLAKVSLWRGKRIDPTGFYYLGARYYDATSGRFLSPDPAGHNGSWDLYSFANNDPVNQFDPDGRFGKPADRFLDSSASGLSWFDRRSQQDAMGDFWSSYHQTQATLGARYNEGFMQPAIPTWGEVFSSALNLTPGVGAAKMTIEGGYTGRDMVTGQRVDRSDWETFVGVSANLAGSLGMMRGVLNEAAQGARFSTGFASWQARSDYWGFKYELNSLRAAEGSVDKSWKLKIFGSPQETGPGHEFRTYREAIAEAKKPDVVAVHIDHGYNRALDLEPKTISPNRRPDVISIYKDGTIKRIEVQSPTDVPAVLRSRNSALDPQIINAGFKPTPPIVVRPH